MEFVIGLLAIIMLVVFAIYKNNQEVSGNKKEDQANLEQKEGQKTNNEPIASYQRLTDTDNPIAKTFYVMGIAIFFFGTIGGLIAANDYSNFYAGIFFSWFIISFICGMIFVGFGEVIKLLHIQVNETKVQSDYLIELSRKHSTEHDKS